MLHEEVAPFEIKRGTRQGGAIYHQNCLITQWAMILRTQLGW